MVLTRAGTFGRGGSHFITHFVAAFAAAVRSLLCSVWLGAAAVCLQGTGGGGDSAQFDSRLYNQDQGMNSGFVGDSEYAVYSK